MERDYYEILQSHPKAELPSLEAAYLRLRDLYDPARLDGAADELVALARQKRDDIERAYAVLGDPMRRAAYDQELAAHAEEPLAAYEEQLDYRPLPPARHTERVKGFDVRPARTVGRAAPARASSNRAALVVAGVLLAVALVGTAVFVFSGASTGALVLSGPTVQPTASPLDQFETDLASAKQRAEQSPNDPTALIDYGNVLYNSVEIVREYQPDSPLYQERVPRWLQATEAYSRALAIQPDNASVRADLGVSSCFYGAGVSEQRYAVSGLSEVEKAIAVRPSDPRVLLSLGHCLVSVKPARTTEALEAWLKVRESQPQDSLFAQQAQQLIQQYGGKG